MRPERILSDESAVYRGNAIGPSATDVAFFKNSDKPPLKHFPSRDDLAPALATSAAIIFIGGCNTSSGSEQKPAGEVLGAAAFETSSKLLNDFIAKWNNKPADFDNAYGAQCVDLVQFWRKAQGGPSFVGDFAYQMFRENPDFYDSIPTSDGTKPQAGDILVWGNKYNNVGGHTGIATGKLDSAGKEIVFEENDPWNSPSHTQSYSLDEPTLLGWLRAKNSPTEIPTKATSEAILDQYLSLDNLEGQNIDQQLTTRALRFWFEEFTTKDNPVVFNHLMGGDEALRISSTNLDEFAPNIPTLFSSTNYQFGMKIDAVFNINYELTGPNADIGEVQIKNLQARVLVLDHFSDVDQANGFQRIVDIDLRYLHRKKYYDSTTNTWSDFSDWSNDGGKDSQETFQYILKNDQLIMGTRDGISYNAEPTNETEDPAREAPWVIYR